MCYKKKDRHRDHRLAQLFICNVQIENLSRLVLGGASGSTKGDDSWDFFWSDKNILKLDADDGYTTL